MKNEKGMKNGVWATETLVDLFGHMEWADASVWNAVAASEAARADAKLRERLTHLHVVQHAFLRTWRGEPRDAPYPTFDDTMSLAGWARSYHREVLAHIQTLVDEDVARPMPVPWVDHVEKRLGRSPGVTTVGDTMLQVILHSTYHRGQINTRLREVGGTPPLVDYIAWIWFGRPVAEWPEI